MKKQIFSRKPIENGTVFNRLTVIEFSHVGSGKRRFYLCQCECGNRKTVSGSHLKNNGVKSCGCLFSEPTLQRGDRFGKLTILRFSHTNKRRSKCYLCKCDCGNKKIANGENMKHGHIKSCGCNAELHYKGPINCLLGRYIKGAKNRELVFDLNEETFCKLICSNCHYCNSPPSNSRKGFKYNGIDRVDNKIGYLKENCVSCCVFCNFAKRDKTKEEFLEWISRVYKHSIDSQISRD